jgi:hypothetical protein
MRDREATAGLRFSPVHEDQALGREEHPAHLELHLFDFEAEEVYGDRLHRHRELGAAEELAVTAPEIVGTFVGNRSGQGCIVPVSAQRERAV